MHTTQQLTAKLRNKYPQFTPQMTAESGESKDIGSLAILMTKLVMQN